jgi:hypothetical protein
VKARTFPGGCVCGATRFALKAAPLFVHCCHCRDCQRQSGAPFIVNAMIEAVKIAVTKGDPLAVAVPSSSSSAHHVFRCPDCASPLWSRYGVRAPMRYVRAAALDTPEQFPPQAHIFVRSKAPWLAIDDTIPAYQRWYDRAKLWPAPSLERLAAARAA